jgi:serine/threonine-protein kinase
MMPAQEIPESSSRAVATPVHDLHGLVGRVVDGRFRVLGLHFAGPRGVVYEVEPPSVGYTRRALKVITLPDGRDPSARERLRGFVETARVVDHPCVARVWDFGVLPDEAPYVLAEWCPLSSLADVLELCDGDDWLPREVALALLARVADGVAALHARGLCHGDLRPAHILTDADDEGVRVVKVIDAGLMAAMDAPPSGGAAGSVAFMAPERFTGQPPTPAADVYALGVLGYLLLAGRLPYTPEDPRAIVAGPDPVDRVRWLHLNASPLRPSRITPDCPPPPAVEAVLGRALSKSPGRRHPSAAAFAAALEVALRAPRDEPWPETRVAVPAVEAPVAPTPLPRAPSPVVVAAPVPVPESRPVAARAQFPLWAWFAAGAAFGSIASILTRV